MRKLALTAAVAAAALVSLPAVDAHPTYHYEGGCYVTASSAETSNSPTWTFAFDIAVVATDAITGVPEPVDITVECALWIDGVWQGVFADGASTTGVVVDHSTVPLELGYDAAVEVCTYVVFHVENTADVDCAPIEWIHPDKTFCAVLPGDDVKVGDKTVYDCPPYIG